MISITTNILAVISVLISCHVLILNYIYVYQVSSDLLCREMAQDRQSARTVRHHFWIAAVVAARINNHHTVVPPLVILAAVFLSAARIAQTYISKAAFVAPH